MAHYEEFDTARPERAATCIACHWGPRVEGDAPPPHTCRTPPTPARTTIEDTLRAADAVFLRRELLIRENTMAEINAARARRGRI
jgi:hypothetical protein